MFSLHSLYRTGGSVLIMAASLTAATYHINPATGDIGNDGSASSPWNTLEAAAAKTLADGDTVLLYDGYHGAVSISGNYTEPVTFMAAPGQHPVLKSLRLISARRIHVKGLTITPEAVTPLTVGTIVTLAVSAAYCAVEGCTVYSVSDAMAWTAAQWDAKTSHGFKVDGPNNVIRACEIRNVKYGMSVTASAESTLVESTLFRYYVGDGIRVVADYGTYRYNQFLDNIATQSNHDANAILSWSYGPGGAGSDTVKGCVVRGNLVIDYRTDDHPFQTNPQCMGIGLYDGMFQDWVIENNIVYVDAWHGISIYGGIDCRIVNNTVVDMNNTSPGPPWIGIFNHKNGTPSSGCTVRNNISTKYTFNGTVINDHNMTIPNVMPYYNMYFNDYAGFDLTLKSTAALAIDAGSAELAPAVDYAGRARPAGAGVDLGAYEYDPDASGIAPTGAVQPVKTGAEMYFTAGGSRVPGIPQHTGMYLVYDGVGVAKAFILK